MTTPDLFKELYLDATLWKVRQGSPLFNHILTFLHTTWGTSNQNFFPGPQPCSIERKNFGTLKKNEYVVCEKTDGIRHVCVCTMFEQKKMCVLVTRSQDMYLAPMNILKPMFDGTILDGELVKTSDGAGWLYMVYDCLMTNGIPCAQRHLKERLALAEVFVDGIMKVKKDPFAFKMKTFWPLSEFSEFQKSTFPYATDGIVFTPVHEPVRSGTHETMFKWKPRDENTIDFLFRLTGIQTKKWSMYVQEKGKMIFESELAVGQELEGTVDGSIVECQYQHGEEPRWWKPLNIRRDKTHPNNRRTFYRTLVNIAENIQLDEFKKM